MKLNNSVTTLSLVGPQKAILLTKLAIFTIKDLLYHFPYTYQDSSSLVTLAKFTKEEKQTALVTVVDFKNIRLRFGGKTLQKAIVQDDSGEV